MSEVSLVEPDRPDQGTQMRRFEAHRGSIIVRETRKIGRLKGQYGDALVASTVVISVGVGAARSVTFGVSLEHLSRDDNSDSTAFLDFDEVPEMVAAFEFIAELAPRMRIDQRDYTEVVYRTKDNVRFGFYQDGQEQQGFLDVQPRGGTLFLDVPLLSGFRDLLEAARLHLVSKGAIEE